MIGDWFEKIEWKQPFRYVDAVVKVGALGVVVIVVAGWVLLGSPTKVETTQIGYRGTSMATLEFESEIERLKEINVMPESEEPYVPAEGDALAKDVYENVQVLGNVTEDNFNRLMLAITEWVSPEQGCAYCHGEDGNFASDAYYPKLVARRMIQMTWEVNSNWQSHSAPAGVNCYTCHRGQNVPQYIWFSPETYPNVGPSAMYQNRADQEVPVYASLPINSIEALLGPDVPVDSTAIQVQARSERAANDTFDYQTGTELTYSLMMHFSDSLGGNCTLCHNSRSWQDWEQSPPQRENAWYGIRMVRTLNAEYLNPLRDTYPAHRLGPKGDAPKANCMTCHQGVQKPLYGASAVEMWPELVSPDPVYSQETAATE
jgi:photosynthetic reaction center cytochrome c subunit